MEYQFIKGARSLPEHIVCHQEFSEGVVWSVAAQLVSLVRHFHSLDTPLRTLHLSKLMLCDDLEATTDAQDGTGQAPVPAATGTQRVLFTGLGMLDILDPLPPGGVPQAMRRDFASLAEVLDDMMMASAKIAAQRAMGNSMTPASAQAVTAALNASFSPALSEFVRICREATSIDAICAAIGPRMAAELGNQMGSAEYVRKEALKEVHNGRLMKLLIRLNMVYAYLQNAQDYDPYYTVRLFFQHLFAPIDDHNRPRRDWGLIYHGLNKFDTRSDDLLQLISPDTGTILVVSYADIATAVEAAENDINAVASGQTTAAAAAASVALGGGVGGTGTTGIGSPLGFPSAATAAAVAAATSLPTLGFAAGIPGISLPGLGLNLPALGVTVGAHHAARVHSAPSLQSTVGSTFAYPPTSGR
jgi:PAB-dependent poly(A)-specific ribonuclease subunit 3